MNFKSSSTFNMGISQCRAKGYIIYQTISNYRYFLYLARTGTTDPPLPPPARLENPPPPHPHSRTAPRPRPTPPLEREARCGSGGGGGGVPLSPPPSLCRPVVPFFYPIRSDPTPPPPPLFSLLPTATQQELQQHANAIPRARDCSGECLHPTCALC